VFGYFTAHERKSLNFFQELVPSVGKEILAHPAILLDTL